MIVTNNVIKKENIMDRKKTNSVTELVKIIAREIIEKHLHDTSFRSTINEVINKKIERHEDAQHIKGEENLSTTATMEVLRIAKGEYWRMEEKVKMWVIKFVKEEYEKNTTEKKIPSLSTIRKIIRRIVKEETQCIEENNRVWAREFLKNELIEQGDCSILETICKTATKCIEGIDNELKSAGSPWPMEEDVLLREEIDIAINRIAANHGRTTTSIRSRIGQKEILKSQRREDCE